MIKQFFHTFKKSKGKMAILMAAVLGMSTIYTYQHLDSNQLFTASILESPLAFDGTVYPTDKVPHWTTWGGDSHSDHYEDLSSKQLMDFPEYDLEALEYPSDLLVWGKAEHDLIRNTQLTYSVVYMGNYEFDHQEHAGSHLAVDIIMPVGTPLRSIANGTVYKVSSDSGFGNHVVIEHSNVPDPENPGQKTTLYSGYGHMDEIFVNEGDVLNKGDFIGKSGNTGISTAPHLHFQIDRAEAPWHLYWPFTWQDAEDANLNFFEAINQGLGAQNGELYTVNPMQFVETHLSGSQSALPQVIPEKEPVLDLKENQGQVQISGKSEVNKIEFGQVIEVKQDSDFNSFPSEDEVVLTSEAESSIDFEPTVSPSGVDTTLFDFDLAGERFGLLGQNLTLRASISDSDLQQMNDGDRIEVEINGEATASQQYLSSSDFSNGLARIQVRSNEVGPVIVSLGKKSFEMNFIETVMPTASLKIEADEQFRSGVPQMIRVLALDENGFRTPVTNFPGTIEMTLKEGQADFQPRSFTSDDFLAGEFQVMMTPQGKDPIQVRAQSGGIVGESETIYLNKSPFFSDVPLTHPNYEAVKYLEKEGVISGYADGTFKPEQTVNRAEAIKMLMVGFDMKTGTGNTHLPFLDTDDNAWYAMPLATALQKSIIEGYSDGTFKPDQMVNKAEYLKMIYETNSIGPVLPLKADPYNDVSRSEWYAGYAYLTNRQNLIDVVNNNLKAEEGMTRGDVAETIYRLLHIMENDLVSFAK